MKVLITGASSGIGRAAALYLSEKGFQVAGASRNPDNTAATSQNAAAFPSVAMDVTDAASVKNGIAKAAEILGGIDVLINNAGVSHVGPFEEMSEEEGRGVMETNFFGAAAVAREVIPIMRRQGKGLIINVSSLAGFMGIPFQSYYAAGKFALEGLSESLRMELAPQNIKVVLVEPGNIKTEINSNRQRHETVPEHYRASYETVREIIEKSVDDAEPPEVIARTIHKIILSKNPKTRYPSGKGSVSINLLVRLLPQFLVEKLLMRYYRL